MLVQDECIGDCDVKDEVKYILIKLVTLGAAVVVTPQLVVTINSSHTIQWLYIMMASGQAAETGDPSFCLQRTVPVADGWEAVDITVTSLSRGGSDCVFNSPLKWKVHVH